MRREFAKRLDRMLPINMRLLKWLAIILPVLFLVILDVFRHTVLSGALHTIPGFIVTNIIIAVAVVIFSSSIFGVIARLQRKDAEQTRQLSILNNIAKIATEKLGSKELLNASLGYIIEALEVDAGLICLVDLQEEEHSAVCTKGFSPEVVRRIQKAKLRDDPIAWEVVSTGRPVIMDRVFEDPRVAEAARREGVRSALSAPLKSEGEVIGILAVATHAERRLSGTSQEFLDGIGGQLGMALRNAVLYEESQHQNRELSALLAVGKAVTSSVDMDELLRTALDCIISVTSADAAEMWLRGNDGELDLACHRGSHPDAFLERTRFRLGEGVPGIVAENRQPMVVHDLSSSPLFLRQAVTKAGFQTFCAIPLLYQNELSGVLTVAAMSQELFQQPRDLRLLEGIGERLAVAIENARLHQQVQELAILQERERIAREMHDGMAQLLGYINTQTIAVRKFLSEGALEEARSALANMEEIARDLYADVREGILGLRTSSSRTNGLLPVLREYAEHYTQMCGIAVAIHSSAEGGDLRLPAASEIQLTRIIQESLTNVRKHSKASTAEVTMEQRNGELTVTIADNGQGFDPAHLPLKGWPRFGLQTMRERAEAIGGTMAVHSAPGAGATIEVHIPLPR